MAPAGVAAQLPDVLGVEPPPAPPDDVLGAGPPPAPPDDVLAPPAPLEDALLPDDASAAGVQHCSSAGPGQRPGVDT